QYCKQYHPSRILYHLDAEPLADLSSHIDLSDTIDDYSARSICPGGPLSFRAPPDIVFIIPHLPHK
ncbi:MAG: hypothetical protein II503_00955, partial [Clostridia bacterium]|nr:hypothetical protein [Clostridia bacterium]